MMKRLMLICFFLSWSASIVNAAVVTLNPGDKDAAITLSNGNLTAAIGGIEDFRSVRATEAKTSGKFYWEIYVNARGSYAPVTGVAIGTASLSTYFGATTSGWGWGSYYNSMSWKYHFTYDPYGTRPVAGTTVMFCLDVDSDKIWSGVNGTWWGDPVAGTGPMFTGVSGAVYAGVSLYDNATVTARFCDDDCVYTAPSGYDYYGDSAPKTYEISNATAGIIETTEGAGGAEIDIMVIDESDGSIEGVTTSDASGDFSVEVTDDTTEYSIFLISGSAIKCIGSGVTGVSQ